MSPWVNFFVVVSAQLLLFLFLAHKKRGFKEITPLLIVKSAVAGVLLGAAFDFLVGMHLRIFSYVLYSGPLFFVVNGALSYGLWFLTLHLLQTERFRWFCVWTIVIGVAYETVNYFYPVWSWTFSDNFWYQESFVVLVVYCGLAMLVALSATLTKQAQFHAFKIGEMK